MTPETPQDTTTGTPVVTEQPVVTKPAETVSTTSDPLKEIMRRTLGAIIEDKPAEPAPAAKPDEPEATTETPVVTTPPEAKPAEPIAAPAPTPPQSSMSKDEIKDLVKEIAAEMKPAPVEAKPAPAEPIKSDFLPEEQAEIDLAKFAAGKDASRYGKLPGEFEEFFRRNKTFIEGQIQKNGSFDPESEEYRDFRKAQMPKLSRNDRENLRVMQAKSEALQEAEVKVKESEARMQREIASLRVAPVIKEEVRRTRETIAEILPDEAKAQFLSSSGDFAKNHLLESRVVLPVAKDMEAIVSEFYRVSTGVSTVDMDNPTHKWLNEFITHQGAAIDAKPEAERRQADGRILVSRQKYHQLSGTDRQAASKYSFIGDDFIVTSLQQQAKAICKERIETVQKELEAAGYRREVKAPKPAGGVAPVVAAPRQEATPTPAAAPGKSPGASGEKPKGHTPSLFASILNGTNKK